MTKKCRAFTLIELLIVCIIISIAFAAIVATSISGTNAAFRVINHSKALAGVRFSFDSMPDNLIRKADGVEILSTKNDSGLINSIDKNIVPENEAYIFISNDKLWCKTHAEYLALNGSEFIKSMDVSISKTVDASSADCYMLHVSLGSQVGDDKDTVGRFAATRSYPLMNVINPRTIPDKTSNNADFMGDVLHLIVPLFDFWNLRVIDDETGAKLTNGTFISKGTDINLAYSVSLLKGTKDSTKKQWYISAKSASSSRTSTATQSNKMNNPNYSSNKLNYDWPLLIKTSDNRYRLANEKYVSDDKTSLHSIDTSGDFYVYTGGSGSFSTDFDDDGYLKDTTKMQVWGQYGYLRAWIEPHYCDENGSNEVHPKKNGSYYDQWSDQIVILVERGGLSFWSDWTSAITSGTNDSEHWLSNASGMSANATVDPTKGNYIALLKQSGGSNNATLAKVINPKYLRDARSYDKTIYGGKSYTSITNYSIVIDAQAGTSTAGIGVSLNGYNNTSGNKGIAGYQFYYDPGANGFPIRLLTRNGIIGSYNANGVAELQSPIRNDMTVTNGAGCDHTANQHDIFYNNYYNAQYNIASIQNSVLNDVPETAADNFVGTRGDFTQECKYMENRHRFIITILEYYDSDEENNRIIVRARLLKTLKQVLEEKEAAGKSTNETELRKTDPFLVGPDFYLSEPMWYGPFVGQKPVVSKNNKTYTFKTMRIGNTNAIVEREQAKDTNNKNIYDSSASYYVLQTDASNGVIRRYSKDYDTRYSENGNSGKYKYIKLEGGIYKCLAMNPRQDLNRDNQLGELGAGRLRWIGLALWGGAISGKSQADIYEMEILPGFNGDELKAIMPSGAKMYNMSETWTSQDISKVDCKYDVNTDAPGMWNSTLFSSGYSDGAGNNSGYSSRFQDSAGVSQICIMSLQHYGHDAESGTKCPICGSYDAYASYYNALSDADKKKIHWGLPTS